MIELTIVELVVEPNSWLAVELTTVELMLVVGLDGVVKMESKLLSIASKSVVECEVAKRLVVEEVGSWTVEGVSRVSLVTTCRLTTG